MGLLLHGWARPAEDLDYSLTSIGCRSSQRLALLLPSHSRSAGLRVHRVEPLGNVERLYDQLAPSVRGRKNAERPANECVPLHLLQARPDSLNVGLPEGGGSAIQYP